MKKLEKLIEELALKSRKPRRYSNPERLKRLGIDAVMKNAIEAYEFSKVNYDEGDCHPPKFEIIEIAELAGINRSDQVEGWLSLLYKLHKVNIFEKYQNFEQFTNYANSLSSDSEDLPHVIEVESKYFIDGNGKHRLTIAKCLGVKCFPAWVSQLKTELDSIGSHSGQ